MIKQNIEDVKNTLKKYDFPQDIIIEITAHCNLQCIMCPQKLLTRPKGNMSFETYKKIINEAAPYKPRIWPAIMGEPFLLKERLFFYIGYAKEMGLDVYLNTNATVMYDWLALLARFEPKEIIIGIDAIEKETYKKIRVGGDFDKVLASTFFLIQNGYNVTVQFIEMEENKDETERFKDFWVKKGARVKIRPRLGWGTGVKEYNLIIPDSERIPCSWLTRTVSIHWDGTIAQCDADWDNKYNVANVNTTTIKDAWNGELAKRRERHWEGDFDFEPCKSCKDWQSGRSYYYGRENDRPK